MNPNDIVETLREGSVQGDDGWFLRGATRTRVGRALATMEPAALAQVIVPVLQYARECRRNGAKALAAQLIDLLRIHVARLATHPLRVPPDILRTMVERSDELTPCDADADAAPRPFSCVRVRLHGRYDQYL